MRILVVMLKDLRLTVRDRWAFVFLLAVPIVVIVVVAETLSRQGTRSIVFAVVNEDQGPVANTLIKVLGRYVDTRQVTLPVARRMVAVENSAPAALILPQGLSKRYLRDQPSTVQMLVDPAQWQGLQAIRVVMLLADREAVSLGDPFKQELLNLKEFSITGERLKFTGLEQHLPGFSLMFVLLTVVFSVSIGLREEEVWRTGVRLSIAPMARWEVIGGKMLARIVIGVAQLMLLLVFAHLVYGLTLGHSPLALLAAGTAIVFCMACFSLIVAGLARTREQAIPVGLSVVFVLAGMGGLWWPFFDQPAWMQTIGRGAMTTWSMFTIQDLMLRGRSLADVAGKILFLLAYGILCFAAGLSLFSFGDRAAR
jgi:ABC-2 type transport system permease protein